MLVVVGGDLSVSFLDGHGARDDGDGRDDGDEGLDDVGCMV